MAFKLCFGFESGTIPEVPVRGWSREGIPPMRIETVVVKAVEGGGGFRLLSLLALIRVGFRCKMN